MTQDIDIFSLNKHKVHKITIFVRIGSHHKVSLFYRPTLSSDICFSTGFSIIFLAPFFSLYFIHFVYFSDIYHGSFGTFWWSIVNSDCRQN